jgi:hypothetical protein
MSTWRNHQRVMDAEIDLEFGEPIELHPMVAEDESIGSPEPDPSRSMLRCIGIYVTPGSAATGESGSIATGWSRSEAGVLTAMEWVSITEDQLGDPAKWGPAVSNHDRVYLPERGTWHTINSITPSATGRFNVNLTRVQEPT